MVKQAAARVAPPDSWPRLSFVKATRNFSLGLSLCGVSTVERPFTYTCVLHSAKGCRGRRSFSGTVLYFVSDQIFRTHANGCRGRRSFSCCCIFKQGRHVGGLLDDRHLLPPVVFFSDQIFRTLAKGCRRSFSCAVVYFVSGEIFTVIFLRYSVFCFRSNL